MSTPSDEISWKMTIILGLMVVAIALGIANLVVAIKNERTREPWYNGEEPHTERSNRACACPGYGFKTDKTMPFNDDSDLYAPRHHPLRHPRHEADQQ